MIMRALIATTVADFSGLWVITHLPLALTGIREFSLGPNCGGRT